MGRARARGSTKLVGCCLGGGRLVMLGTFRRLHRPGRRRWLLERDVDQPLYDLAGVGHVDPQTGEQGDGERYLNDGDRGKRRNALPRPHDLRLFGVGGHDRPLQRLTIVAAPRGAQAAVDGSARDDTANGSSGRSEQSVPKQTVADERACNASDDLAGRSR